jgi:hypothetical protein
MAGKDVVLAVHDDRVHKAEFFDRIGDLPDLLARVCPRVALPRVQLVHGDIRQLMHFVVLFVSMWGAAVSVRAGSMKPEWASDE